MRLTLEEVTFFLFLSSGFHELWHSKMSSLLTKVKWHWSTLLLGWVTALTAQLVSLMAL